MCVKTLENDVQVSLVVTRKKKKVSLVVATLQLASRPLTAKESEERGLCGAITNVRGLLPSHQKRICEGSPNKKHATPHHIDAI